MKLYWTNRAKQRLRLIEEYIAEDSPAVARRVVHQLLKEAARLLEVPNSGREVPEYKREDIRETLKRPYRVIYRIRPDQQVDVLTVMHYRQLLPIDLEEL